MASKEPNDMSHLLVGAGLTGAAFVLYSTVYRGAGLTNEVFINAAAASAASVGAETAVRFVAPHIIPLKQKGLNGGIPLVLEGALAGAMYSRIFPIVFPQFADTPMMNLFQTGAALDIGAQLLQPRIEAALVGEQTY